MHLAEVGAKIILPSAALGLLAQSADVTDHVLGGA